MAGRRSRSAARSPCSDPRPGPGPTVLRPTPSHQQHLSTAAAPPQHTAADMGSVRLYAAGLLLLTVCCCLCQPALGRPGSSQPPLLRQKRNSHYCGSHLASMLEFLCGGGVVGKRADSSSARTGAGNMHDFSGDQRANELGSMVHDLEELPASSRQRLLDAVHPLGGSRRRESRSVHPGGPDHVRVKRQGIVYECCFKACSIDALRAYCNS